MGARGFTLFEVLIAMVILSITFVPLLVSESQGLSNAMEAKFLTTSTLLAQKHIAEMDASGTPAIVGQKNGDFGEEYPGYTYKESIETTPLSGYYKYSITVIWGSGRGGLENKFVTFLSVQH
jgi:prepilin-type N-terminal cleavage/methylation domain-containing protein